MVAGLTGRPPAPREDNATLVEINTRLRYRLRLAMIGSAVGFAALAVLAAFDADEFLSRRLFGAAGIALFAAAGAWSAFGGLWLGVRRVWSERDLRLLEAVLVGFAGGVLAYWQVVKWGWIPPGGFRSTAHQSSHQLFAHFHAQLTWFIVVVLYGVFIPNTFRTAGGVVAVPVVLDLTLTVWACVEIPGTADRAPLFLSSAAGVLFIGTAVALFGTYKLDALQKAADDARRQLRELGQYRLVRKLGEGGMGEVYLAEHRLIKRPCAVKFITPQYLPDATALARFEREAHATAMLKHPNVVELYDFGRSDDGTVYFAMEFIDGKGLDEVVATTGPLPPARAVHVLRQLCWALAAAHKAGLVHRDVKPSNVMVCPTGRPHDLVKLLDFGLVQAAGPAEGAGRITNPNTVVGTPEYMSPEQVEGADLDGRCDLYSLGATAYFVLTGRPPFEGDKPVQTMIAQVRQTPKPLRELNPAVPEELEAFVSRCLQKEPAWRYGDAAEAEAALAACAGAGEWTEEMAAEWWRKQGRKSRA